MSFGHSAGNLSHTGIDCTSTIQQIEEDIAVIEAGRARLDGATGGNMLTGKGDQLQCTSPAEVIPGGALQRFDETWRTGCHQAKQCKFEVNASVDQEGVGVTITSRGEVSASRQ
ncbi:hypothetical protein ACRQ5Q_16550 [Bradyrhizobium sp. PMVTL-01]|uniref:hypothetical protein n=1 Tax=Bradyrhizobium sp. PMVTL-01 TaxID=3434999 RepID=UPI003F714098